MQRRGTRGRWWPPSADSSASGGRSIVLALVALLSLGCATSTDGVGVGEPPATGSDQGAVGVPTAGAGTEAGGGGADRPDAQSLALPEAGTTYGETVAAVAEVLSPAVVTILTTGGLDMLEAGPGASLPPGGVFQGVGSGVIVDPDGIILTNRHVLADADSVTVVLADGRQLTGTVAGVDTYTDFALVRVDEAGLPTADLGGSEDIRVGQLVVAVGSPLGRLVGSVSAGVVSGLQRSIPVMGPEGAPAVALRNLIQTDAAINPGNSGGALANAAGEVIGINTATAGDATGIGFALPVEIAVPIIEQVRAGEPIARPWLGVNYRDIEPSLAQALDLPVDRGAWIGAPEGRAIVPGSPAEEAGLRSGDIIVSFEGRPVDEDRPLDLALLSHSPGETVELTVLRDGQGQELELTLGTRPAATG